jgi:hypothetical protein
MTSNRRRSGLLSRPIRRVSFFHIFVGVVIPFTSSPDKAAPLQPPGWIVSPPLCVRHTLRGLKDWRAPELGLLATAFSLLRCGRLGLDARMQHERVDGR